MVKLHRTRSLPYRRQILQEDVRWKALDEIYKIYMLLHLGDPIEPLEDYGSINVCNPFKENTYERSKR